MAQVTQKSHWFEQHWRPRINLATKLLREFQARWLQTDSIFPSREVAAVLLNVFAFDFYTAGLLRYEGVTEGVLWRRNLDEWLSAVGSAETECKKLCPNRSELEIQDVVAVFCARLSDAAAAWEFKLAGANEPEFIVQYLIDALTTRKLIRIRYD